MHNLKRRLSVATGLAVAVAVAVLLGAAASSARAAENEGIPSHGGWVELGFGQGVTFGGVASFNAPIPAIAGGVRFANRVNLGLGFTFFRLSVRTPPVVPGGTPGGADTNLFNFAPTVEIDLVKSRDDRAAFYVRGSLPIGALVVSHPNGPDDSGFFVGYDLSLGARYAFNRFFSFGLQTGLLGLFANPQRSDGNESMGVTTFYGMLVGTVFFAGR